MRRRSVVAKLWLAFIGLILTVLVPLGFALDRLLTDFYANQVTEPLLYHSTQLAHMLGMDPQAIDLAPMMGQMVGGQVLVVDQTGRPVGFPGGPELAAPPLALQSSLAGRTYVGQTDGYVVTAAPIPGRGGAVLLLAPAEPIRHSLLVARRYLLMAGTLTLLLGTGLALQLSRSLLQPVIAIEQATRQIAQGDFSTRVAVTSSDEIGELAGAVNQMTAQLEAYESRRREFLANVAHELRTPLSYVQGYTQALTEGLVATPEDRERYQAVVHEEARRLGRLVDDLMDLAQLEEGQMAIEAMPLDLRVPVEQALDTVRPMAGAKNVRLELDLPPDLPTPIADGGRIQQVVFNLLDNGLRHTPTGGSLRLEATATETWVTVRVSDTGAGLDPEILPVVFERFHKRSSSGRGLGLAIVRSIVRAHGGEVGVESKPGQGATFWFRLPLPRASYPNRPVM